MDWYKFYVGDYARDTVHLTALEHGVYRLLIDHYHAKESPLPDDFAYLCRVARCHSRHEKDALRSIRDQFFDIINGELRHDRIDKNIQEYQRACDAARTSAAQRWHKDRNANPESRNQSPDTKIQKPESRVQKPEKKQPGTTIPTWDAYFAAYRDRYGVDPVRNRTVNGQLAAFVSRLGAEAPAVARYYLTTSRQFYVQASHPVGLMLRDCEGLHTEMLTGQHITGVRARQIERKRATYDAFAPLIAAAEASERAEREANERAK